MRLGFDPAPPGRRAGSAQNSTVSVLIKAALRCEELEGSQPPWGPGPALSVLCFPFHCVSETMLAVEGAQC